MAFVRLLRDLMRDKGIGPRIVPIIPDEARTFGMDSFFPTAKIYNPNGQQYTAVDRALMLAYKESDQGQILHTGINEAGSMAAFTAVGTSYATHGEPMIPVYVFYSMFGFQRTGDQMWAAMDQMTRGFIIGATAGRTTLTGEGLQHADGHSPVLAATNPAMKIYDPAYGYEIAHIVSAGLQQMYGPDSDDPNVMYYLTVYNEPMLQPAEPDGVDVDGIVRGIHQVARADGEGPRVQLLGSGVSVPWVLDAARLLEQDWGVAADVWSVTSWTELRRDGLAAEEHNFLHPEAERRVALRHPEAGRRAGTGDRHHRLRLRGPRPDPPVPAPPVRHARGRRPRLLRHPGSGPAVVPHRRPLRRGPGAADARRGRPGRPVRRRWRPRSATSCST